MRNPRLLQALMKAVELRGGVIVEDTEVTRWNMAGGRVRSVSTSRGEEYAAANYVVTAGAWSGRLLHQLALKLDIWPVRGQILLFRADPGLLDVIVLKEPEKFYLIPRRDGHILAGSTLEDAGFDKGPNRRGPGDATCKGARAGPGINRRRPCCALGGLASGIAR